MTYKNSLVDNYFETFFFFSLKVLVAYEVP